MSKDSYWFRHDSNAGRGLKMRKMAHIYGHQGKGLYWDVVEILRDQDGYMFECDESSLQMLADLVGFKDSDRFISWFNDSLRLGLFEQENESFFCPPLVDNMEKWEIKKSNGSKGGRPLKTESKPKHKPNGKHKIIEQNITEHNRTEDNIELYPAFIDFWDLYDKKEDRAKCLKKWNALKQPEKEKIIEHVPLYVQSTPEKQFRRNPSTYLNNESWNNEIISNEKGITKIKAEHWLSDLDG